MQEYPGRYRPSCPWVGRRLVPEALHGGCRGRGRAHLPGYRRRHGLRGVWLNGQVVGGWPYGYASFRLDLTPYIRAGAENVAAIALR